jgi:hypothetical protein
MSTVNIVPADNSACAHYRLLQVARLLQLKGLDVTISPAGKFRAMAECDTIYTQRLSNTKLLKQILDFKKATGVKMIVDWDDLVWKDQRGTIPDYNWCSKKIDLQANTEGMAAHLDDVADVVTCSTEPLKYALSKFVAPEKIHVIPNMLSYEEWGFNRFNPLPDKNIFYFAGSDTHFSNTDKMNGDFSDGLIRYLTDKPLIVKNRAPWFFNDPVQIQWSTLNRYARDLFKESAGCRFIVAPLADNFFNTCKSDLKYLEAAAVGRVALVSDFPNSPYANAHPYQKIPVNATYKEIEWIVERANNNYKEILSHQWRFLNDRWLDNHLDEYIKILGLEEK